MSVEVEILNAVKLKKDADDFDDRQDYLATVVKAMDKMPAEAFDGLSDEAADWYNEGVAKLNKKKEIPDFDEEVSGNDVSPGLSAAKRKAVNAAKEESNDTDTEPHTSAGEGASVEAPADTPPAKAKKAKAKKEPKEAAVPRGPRVVNGALEKDRFGVTLGTKTAAAVALYNTPTGATMKEIDDKVGGRHMNVLTRLAKDGHNVEKLEGGRFRLIHKEDFGADAKSGTTH